MNKSLYIIIIEDVDTDSELIQRELRKAGINFNAVRVETALEFEESIHSNLPDLILSDFSLPRFNALEALKIRNRIVPDVPFVLVTGAQSEETAVQCIIQGADDYLLKGSLARLSTAVTNALKVGDTRKERKEAILQLKLREEKYRNLFENSLIGILRWQFSDGKILEMNKKSKQITQLYCDEKNAFQHCFLKEEDYSQIIGLLKENLIIEDFEFEVKNNLNETRWLNLSAKLFLDDNEVEAVIQDISKSKESIIELQKINYELDRFVYHASHDLKSPLRSILGLVQAARDSETLEECFSFLELFEQSATKLESLVNDLLLLARSNRAEENFTLFNFNQEIQECLHLLSHTDKFPHIRIETDISQEYDFITDAVRLRIILNNILSNAVKYHHIHHSDPFIRIDVDVSKEKATIIIKDNGEGIAESHLPRIFDMFYRASKSSEGSGLGLYIVKSMIETIGGNVQLSSKLNEGTTFTIVLPNHLVIENSESEEVNQSNSNIF